MKKQCFRQFNALFDCLQIADLILSGNSDRSNKTKRQLNSEIVKATAEINQVIWEDFGKGYLSKVFDEIDDNLYTHPLNQKEYIEDLLRELKKTASYLDEEKYCPYEEQYQPEDQDFIVVDLDRQYDATCKYLSRFKTEHKTVVVEFLPVAERYVLYSKLLMSCFFKLLDGRCVNFGLDLMEIQKETNIFIQRSRYVDGLINAGYCNKVQQLGIEKNPVQKPLSASSPPIIEGKPFPGYLLHPNPGLVAALCCKLFDTGHSPKDYAIMFCLLSQHGLIIIRERQRKFFFKAWYEFIGRGFSDKENFYAINKFIEVKPDCVCFKNDRDHDYHELEKKFILELKELMNNAN